MNAEAVEEMLERRGKLEDAIRMMRETNAYILDTPYGPVKISEMIADAKFIDALLMDEFDDLPISGVLINLI